MAVTDSPLREGFFFALNPDNTKKLKKNTPMRLQRGVGLLL